MFKKNIELSKAPAYSTTILRTDDTRNSYLMKIQCKIKIHKRIRRYILSSIWIM